MKFNFLCGLAAVTGGAQATKMEPEPSSGGSALYWDLESDQGFPVGFTKSIPHVPRPASTLGGTSKYPGNLKDGIYTNEWYYDDAKSPKEYRLNERIFQNEGRQCPNCPKFCAPTMDCCNGCTASLEGVDISYPDNTIMSFIFGGEKLPNGRFDATISIRHETPEQIVFDDFTYNSGGHLLAVPTSEYIPDFRDLFNDPAKGLALVESLEGGLDTVLAEQFLGTEEWWNEYGQGVETVQEAKELGKIVMGFNFPPSQKQLHIQCIIAPFLPKFHYNLMRDEQLGENRFFPLEYVKICLRKVAHYNEQPGNQHNPFTFGPNEAIEKLVARLDAMDLPDDDDMAPDEGLARDVSYKTNFDEMIERAKHFSEQYQWDLRDFEAFVYPQPDGTQRAFKIEDGSITTEEIDTTEKKNLVERLTNRDYGFSTQSFGNRGQRKLIF